MSGWPTVLSRRALLASALSAWACQRPGSKIEEDARPVTSTTPAKRMPLLFLGHGSPMNAIEDNDWSRAFQRIGRELPQPRAIVCVSAHWYGEGTRVTDNERPKTIHDFGGFPEALHRAQYPAPGDVSLAKRVTELVPGARLNGDWGLDHGAWSVLVHLRPAADCPVVQLSLDSSLTGARHLELGRALAPLRDEGVLILGSGNIVHNLRDAFGRMRRGDASTPAWASSFDADTERALLQHDGSYLARAHESSTGREAHPTVEHYLPLLYVAGAASPSDRVSFPIRGFDAGSLSMRAVRYDS
jgi:4,5-DOPA dioxygenase extradiol